MERHINDYFAAHRGALPAAGLYDRVLREVERPLIVATLARDPRQSDQGGASVGTEPQYAAQENPRIGHPGRPRLKIAALRRRHPVRGGAKAGASPACAGFECVGIGDEPGAADPRLGRRSRPVAKNGDRAGGGGPRFGHRDLSRADRRAAVRPGPARRPDPAPARSRAAARLGDAGLPSGSSRSGSSAAAALPVRGCRCGWSGCSA